MPTTLILVPTAMERRGLGFPIASRDSIQTELCGFGPVAAAARAARFITAQRPDRVILVGLAGRFDDGLEIGRAYQFDEVGCFGVGAGTGESFLTAGAMGWPQWPGDPASSDSNIGDVLPLSLFSAAPSAGQLLTACAASASDRDVAMRRRLYPAARGEDMEGFGVAMACHLAGVPLSIIRGISNNAGDRETSRWQIAAALDAAAALTSDILEVSK